LGAVAEPSCRNCTTIEVVFPILLFSCKSSQRLLGRRADSWGRQQGGRFSEQSAKQMRANERLGTILDDLRAPISDDTPLDSLSLSVRTRNCLSWTGIKTVGEARAMRDGALLMIPNFGRKSLAELRVFAPPIDDTRSFGRARPSK
jgi:Bacterial RNA polymerase, alpha chain C terminal domain